MLLGLTAPYYSTCLLVYLPTTTRRGCSVALPRQATINETRPGLHAKEAFIHFSLFGSSCARTTSKRLQGRRILAGGWFVVSPPRWAAAPSATSPDSPPRSVMALQPLYWYDERALDVMARSLCVFLG